MMTMQFCGSCGNILDISTYRTILCDCCGSMNDNNVLDTASNTSTDKFPSELRQRRGTTKQLPRQAAVDTWAMTQETCRKCGAEEVRYMALQLRSADEGSTLFYHCPQCLERWNEDN